MPLTLESLTFYCENCGHRITVKTNVTPPRECSKCHNVTKMTRGKYKDVDIAFINSGYLKWVMEQDWFLNVAGNEPLIAAIQRELEIRDRSNGHFREDKVKV